LLDRRPRVLERILPAAPRVGDAGLSLVGWSYLAVLPRCSEAAQEIRQGNAVKYCCLGL
jgi:hypothetical protein